MDRMPSNSASKSGTDIFRLLVERVKEYAIFALDANGRVVSWNEGAQRLKGYSADEIIGQPYEIFFPPESKEIGLPRRLLRRATEEGQVEDEGWRVRKDGTRFWADALLTALYGEDGELLGYAKVTRDLTERRLHEQQERELLTERVARRVAEEARVEAERHALEELGLREIAHALAAAEGSSDALARVPELALSLGDADGAYIERVDEGRERVEVVAGAGTGHPPIGTRAPFPGSLTEAVLSSGQPELVADIAAAEGRPMGRILRDSCGTCAGLVAPLGSDDQLLGGLVLLRHSGRPVFTDVDAKRVMILADMGALALRRALVVEQAEEHAREESALRRAAASVSAAFTVEEMLPQIALSALEATGADGSVVERLSADNHSLEIVAADGEIRLPLGSSVPYAGSYAEYVIQQGEPVVIPRLDRVDRPVPPHWKQTCPECSALLLGLVDAGEVIGALLLLRSPEHAPFRPSEIARARAFANLVSLAFRKVHLLEESERRRQELERVMESRARLVRGFSHDVKNPLSASLGFVELLRDGFMGAPSPEQRRALERASAGIRAAVGLIDDLVDLARAEAGSIEVNPEAVDLRAVARELAGQYSAAAEQKSLRLSVDLPTTLPPVHTDPTRVRQVLGNLLSNAVKYTPAGGAVEVRLNERTARREGEGDGGPWLALHVIDTGPGIAPEDQERIFEEFTRLAPGAAEGAGLGLAISRRIARLLGGDLTVESEPGHGSNFTLWLPAALEGGPPGHARAAADRAREPG